MDTEAELETAFLRREELEERKFTTVKFASLKGVFFMYFQEIFFKIFSSSIIKRHSVSIRNFKGFCWLPLRLDPLKNHHLHHHIPSQYRVIRVPHFFYTDAL